MTAVCSESVSQLDMPISGKQQIAIPLQSPPAIEIFVQILGTWTYSPLSNSFSA